MAADQVPVTQIIRMHGDRHIAKHGFGTGSGDDQSFCFCLIQTSTRIFERIENMPEKSIFLRRYHLQIGDGGLQHRIPIHQSLAAIDQSFAIKSHENFSDGVG